MAFAPTGRAATAPRALARVGSACALATCLVSCGGPTSPNIVLVTVDTLRADRLGNWAYPRGTTPAIDRFTAQGTSFVTNIVPRGQTWPTLASILTSQYPVTHGVRKNGQALVDEVRTLGEVLAEQGYQCGAFLSNSGHAAWPGFDPLEDLRDEDGRLLAHAKGWMRGNAEGPFFLWIHFFSPHRPFQPPPPYVDLYDAEYSGPVDGSIEQMKAITAGELPFGPRDLRHMNARYDGEIRHLDRLFGELMDALDEQGLAGNTVVAFTADHGEELFERHRYFSHSASIYDSVLRAPLAFRWPGKVPARRTVEGITESIDVAPTLLALAGLGIPADWEGRALDEVIAGRATLDDGHAAVSELEDRIVSLRTPRERYIYNPDDFDFPMEGGATGLVFPIDVEELYLLGDDPGERVNRAAERPDQVEALRTRTQGWMTDHLWEEARTRHAGSEIPDHVRESLEAIGYMN